MSSGEPPAEAMFRDRASSNIDNCGYAGLRRTHACLTWRVLVQVAAAGSKLSLATVTPFDRVRYLMLQRGGETNVSIWLQQLFASCLAQGRAIVPLPLDCSKILPSPVPCCLPMHMHAAYASSKSHSLCAQVSSACSCPCPGALHLGRISQQLLSVSHPACVLRMSCGLCRAAATIPRAALL